MKVIAETIELLRSSTDSLYTHHNVDEIMVALQAIQTKFEQTRQLDQAQLDLLFAPTGSIQEIAIDNGWGEEFLQIHKKWTSLLVSKKEGRT